MKITQFSMLNPKFLRIVLFLALSAIFLYSFSGIASIFAPDVGAIVYALISCLALFFSIIILIVNHLLHPRRFFLSLRSYYMFFPTLHSSFSLVSNVWPFQQMLKRSYQF